MPPMALAADGSRVAVLAEERVYESTDNGATFTQRVTGHSGALTKERAHGQSRTSVLDAPESVGPAARPRRRRG